MPTTTVPQMFARREQRPGEHWTRALLVDPTGDVPTTAETLDAAHRHNEAVRAVARADTGVPNDLRWPEAAVIGMLDGIRHWTLHPDVALVDGEPADYYSVGILRNLYDATVDALNYDLGRLQGGWVHEYLLDLVAPWGIE